MSRAGRLQPARDVADRREREAAGELARGRAALAQAEARLEELRRFRSEYSLRFASPPGGALPSAGLLKDGHVFLARVDAGIAQAERQVQEHRRHCDTLRSRWLDKRVRARAIDKLAERHLARETRQAERVEQNEQDEFANRRDR